MTTAQYPAIFTPERLATLFPPKRSEAFFEALYGDVDEAAFFIRLEFLRGDAQRLHFQFRLEELPGKCLACNMTYGLPKVFARHPVLNLNGLVSEIGQALDIPPDRLHGKLGHTVAHSSDLHLIPLTITILAGLIGDTV